MTDSLLPHSRGRIVLLCGLPGAGKSTLAKAMIATHGALGFSPDEWLIAIDPVTHTSEMREHVETLQWNLALDLAGRGARVVLENGFWTKSERNGLRGVARSRLIAIELHYLEIPHDELWRRLEERNVQQPAGSWTITRTEFDNACNVFEPPRARELAQFDASTWSARTV